MKKFFKFLPMLLIALIGSVMFLSCSDDKDEPISSDALPTQAKAFISQYYPSATILSTTKDKDEYEVILSEGTRIDFNKSGDWIDVEAPIGKAVPTGFYPTAIDNYINANFNGIGINEISKENRGYDVELVTGTEIYFNKDGNFIGYDWD